MKNNLYCNVNQVESNFVKLYGENSNEQKLRYQNAFSVFFNSFNEKQCYVASSSGRVEVCGNHTDHNGGKVISTSISLDTLAMFLPTNDNVIHIISEGYNDIVINLNEKEDYKLGTSTALVYGVRKALVDMGYKVGGFKAYFTSNVPSGAGVSSSASFEVLIAEIFNFLYNDGKISNKEKSIASQFAENVYFGKPCGLLDQTAIAFGGLKKLDFKNKGEIIVEDVECDLSNYTFVLINSGGSHADLTDEYAAIPSEMYSVAKLFGKDRLIEILEEEFYRGLPTIINKVSDRAINRAIHFYNENRLVDNVANALKQKDYKEFLSLIKSSGISSAIKLQNCSVPTQKVQPIIKALSIAEHYIVDGANRVHGGGFAGSILNIVNNEQVNEFINSMKDYYNENDIVKLHVRSVGTMVL